jgi:hypothetical protein
LLKLVHGIADKLGKTPMEITNEDLANVPPMHAPRHVTRAFKVCRHGDRDPDIKAAALFASDCQSVVRIMDKGPSFADISPLTTHIIIPREHVPLMQGLLRDDRDLAAQLRNLPLLSIIYMDGNWGKLSEDVMATEYVNRCDNPLCTNLSVELKSESVSFAGRKATFTMSVKVLQYCYDRFLAAVDHGPLAHRHAQAIKMIKFMQEYMCIPVEQKLRTCSVCKVVTYCSEKCQKEHWTLCDIEHDLQPHCDQCPELAKAHPKAVALRERPSSQLVWWIEIQGFNLLRPQPLHRAR